MSMVVQGRPWFSRGASSVPELTQLSGIKIAIPSFSHEYLRKQNLIKLQTREVLGAGGVVAVAGATGAGGLVCTMLGFAFLLRPPP